MKENGKRPQSRLDYDKKYVQLEYDTMIYLLVPMLLNSGYNSATMLTHIRI
jgi:hypothetical protein